MAKAQFEYPKGVRKDAMPDFALALVDRFQATYSAAEGYTVKTRRDHSNDAARWFVYVHRGLTAGFSVLTSAPYRQPRLVTVTVSWSSRILRMFAILGFVLGVGVGLVVLAVRAQEIHNAPGAQSMLIAFLFGIPAAAVMYGVGWIVARVIAAGAGNPFPRAKLDAIAADVATVMTEDGARQR